MPPSATNATLEVIETAPDLSVVALRGVLDTVGVSDVELKFLASTASRQCNSIVHLSDIEFINSLGVGMLISACNALKQHDASLMLVAPTDIVRSVLERGGLSQVISIVDSIDEARALLQ